MGGTLRRASRAAESPSSKGSWLAFADLGSVFGRRPTRYADKRDLVAALNDVADAVSSAMDLDDVLTVIVERAKLATHIDKAILILADERGTSLDIDSVVVRGARNQHPQEWWEARLLGLGSELFEGREVAVEAHPEHHALMLILPVRVRAHPIGVICAINSSDRPFTDSQIEFLTILSTFAAASIENTRLAEQGRYMLLSSERNRIAREMHDGVLQSMFSVSLGLEVCKKLVTHDTAVVVDRLAELQEHLNSSMAELRRLVYDLRSMRLKELGLERAIEYWIREVAEGDDAPTGRLIIEGMLPAMSPQLESCLYRVAKESVSNVVKHARATSFEVRMFGAEDAVTLIIEDDGDGFDVDTEASDDSRSKLGLNNMRVRVEREGGRFTIASTADVGTRIMVEFTDLGGT